jgi:hypothetical protein
MQKLPSKERHYNLHWDAKHMEQEDLTRVGSKPSHAGGLNENV